MKLFVEERFKVDVWDRMFYALIPVLGYLLVVTAGAMLFMRITWGAEVLAAGLLTLLLAGIRNAWDMMLWIVIRTPANPTDKTPAP